ncbi:MAG: hypothetical protein KIS68_07845 [Bauldia sp.]|nr:hypothetical protein [Bauldia sp.]
MPDTIVGGSAAAILTNLYDLRDLGLIDADVAARIEAALGSGNSAVIARAVDDLEATEADAAYFGLDPDYRPILDQLEPALLEIWRPSTLMHQMTSAMMPTTPSRRTG